MHGKAAVKTPFMSSRSPLVINCSRSQGERVAVYLGRASYSCGFAELLGHFSDSVHRDATDPRHLLRINSTQMFLENLKRRLVCASGPMEIALNGRIFQVRCIIGFGLIVSEIPDKGFVRLLISQIGAVLADKVGPVGLMLEKRHIIHPQLVDHDMEHGQG